MYTWKNNKTMTIVLYRTISATYTLDMNHTPSNISTTSIGLTAVSTVCLYLLSLPLFCSYRTTFHTGTSLQFIHQNWTYHMTWPLDCTDISIEYIRKERLMLGQAWFELYCASYYSYSYCRIHHGQIGIWFILLISVIIWWILVQVLLTTEL